MGVSLIVALVLWRHALWQSVALAATVFLLGATLASGQRDHLSAAQERGLTVRQWQRQQQVPDADSRLGRSRLYFLQLRERVLQRYRQQGLDGEAYAMVAAMSVGDKSAVSKDVRQSYNVSGAAHVLALSGLHMGIIYALLTLLTSRLRLRLLSQTVIVLSLWAFVFLVGMPPSAVRSATMLSLYALLSLGYRQHTSVNALAFTAIVILIVSPYTLFDIGFQLSFVSVLSILVWLPIMERWVPLDLQQRHRMVRWLWGMTAVSLAAQLGAAPLVAYYFGRFSTYFLLTNFLAIPAVMLILYLALGTLLWAPLAVVLSTVVSLLNKGLAAISRWPLASIENLQPSGLQIALIYLLILAAYWLYVLFSPSASRSR